MQRILPGLAHRNDRQRGRLQINRADLRAHQQVRHVLFGCQQTLYLSGVALHAGSIEGGIFRLPVGIDDFFLEIQHRAPQVTEFAFAGDKAARPLGQRRRLALVQHLAPFLIRQAVIRRPLKFVIGENPAFDHLQRDAAVAVNDRRHGVDFVDAPYALLQHRGVGDAVSVRVGIGGYIGDHGCLRFFLYERLSYFFPGVHVGSSHRQVFQFAAVITDALIFFVAKRLSAQFFLRH